MARKELGLVLKEKERTREILTGSGKLNLPRDYYYDKKHGKSVMGNCNELGWSEKGQACKAESVTESAQPEISFGININKKLNNNLDTNTNKI